MLRLNNTILGLVYFFSWVLIVIFSTFLPWNSLPDVVLVCLVCQAILLPQLPVWRFVLPISILMDCGAGVFLGFHALLYLLVIFGVYILDPIWHKASTFKIYVLIVFFAFSFQLLKYLLYYFLVGLPAPNGWYFTLLFQLIIWIPLRYILMSIYNRFFSPPIS